DAAQRAPGQHRQVVDQLVGAHPRVRHPRVGGQLHSADGVERPRRRAPVSIPTSAIRRRSITPSMRAMICSEFATALLLLAELFAITNMYGSGSEATVST